MLYEDLLWEIVGETVSDFILGGSKITAVHYKRDQSWVFFGRTDAKAETPIFSPPDARS